jgi:hypothetical protein
MPSDGSKPLAVTMLPLPGNIVAADGSGFVSDLLANLYGSVQTPLRQQTLPVKRALETFDRQQADVVALVPVCRWHAAVYVTLGIRDFERFYARSAAMLPASESDLAGKRIAVVRGYTHALQSRLPNLGWTEARDYGDAFRMLKADVVDLVYGFAYLANATLSSTSGLGSIRYDDKHNFDETVPALVFHNNTEGRHLAEQSLKLLEEANQRGSLRLIALHNKLPDWLWTDAAAGKFQLIEQAQCPELDSPAKR